MLKIWSIFNFKQKIELISISFLVFFNTALEAISISFFIPIVVSLTNNNLAELYPQFSNIMIFFSDQLSTNTINSSLILFGITIVIKNVFQIFIDYKEIKFLITIQEGTSQRLLKKYLNNNYNFHLENKSADLITKIRNETRFFSEGVSSFYGIIAETILIAGLAILLFYFAYEVTLISLITIFIFSLIFVKIVNKQVVRHSQKRADLEFKKHQLAQESIQGVREIIISNIINQVVDKYIIFSNNFAKSVSVYALILKIPKIYFELLILIMITTTMFVISNYVKDVNYALILPTLTLYAAAGFRLLPSANRFINFIQRLKWTTPSINQVYKELLNEKSNMKISEKVKIKKIELRNLSFSYKKPFKKILDNVNLKINAGEKIMIHGKSGIGKSTFLDLIIGLQFPNEGKIIINDKNEINKDLNLINSISYISQNNFIFNKSLKENICLNPKEYEQNKFDKIINVTQLKDLQDHLSKLKIDDTVDFGSTLSGGQKQRIMIARALYKSESFILMDEPTSSLDFNTAEKIIEGLTSKSSTTLLMVTHSTNFKKYFNRVLEIKEGEFIEHNHL